MRGAPWLVLVAACAYDRPPFTAADAGGDGDAPKTVDAAPDAIDAPIDVPIDAAPPPVITALAAGGSHTCAATENGRLRCWGLGTVGQLGHGNVRTIGDDEPAAAAADVMTGLPVGRSITAGTTHTCAVVGDGAVRCWGDGASGRLGYGSLTSVGDDEVPASVSTVNIGNSVTMVAAGSRHTCVRSGTGTVRCWGEGVSGQLGYGNLNSVGDNEVPASVGLVDVGGSVTQVVAGDAHTCALMASGAVRCWGSGSDGRLGYGHVAPVGDNEPPSAESELVIGSAVLQLAAGGAHTCALIAAGAVRCWGDNAVGQLGYGNTADVGDNETPQAAGNVNVGGFVVQLAAGARHTCARLASGTVRCWGAGANGRLGYGATANIGDNEPPASAGDIVLGATAELVVAGGNHTCALLTSGAVRCWGAGTDGALGYGNTADIGDDELPSTAGDVPVF